MSELIPFTDLRTAGGSARIGVVRPWGLRYPVQLLLLGGASAGDFANFYITMSLVANAYPLVTVLVVAALTAAAVALAHGIGVLLREQQHSGRRRVNRGLIVLVACWGLLGLSATAVRGVAPFSTGPVSAVTQFGAASATAAAASDGAIHLVTSLLLLGLYVASGALAAWIAYIDHHPAQAALRTAWRRLAWTGYRHRRRQSRQATAESVLRQHLTERDRLATDYDAAIADRTALADELHSYTRVLIAGRLGDPVATEALTRGPWTNRATGADTGPETGLESHA